MPIVLQLWHLLASPGELVTGTEAEALPLNQKVWGGACPLDLGLTSPTQSQPAPAQPLRGSSPWSGHVQRQLCASGHFLVPWVQLLSSTLAPISAAVFPTRPSLCVRPCAGLLPCFYRDVVRGRFKKMRIWRCHPGLKNTPVTFHCS